MGKKSAPAPPDPVATAKAQGKLNTQAAIDQQKLNMVDQFTPYGSLIYSPAAWDSEGYGQATDQYNTDLSAYNQKVSAGGGGSRQGMEGTWGKLGTAINTARFGSAPTAPDKSQFGFDPLRMQATQTLSPENQRMLDLQNQAGIKFGETANTQLNQVSDRLSQPLDFSSLGDAPVANEETRKASVEAMLARLQPVWDQDQRKMNADLINRGLMPGSEAWRRATDDFNRMKTDARFAADQYGGDEMARTFGLELTGRNQGINEMERLRSGPINELSAMLSGSQVTPAQYVNAPQGRINPADLTGATYASYQGEVDRQNQKNSVTNALMGGLFGLGSAGLGAYGLSKMGPSTVMNF